MSSSRRQTPGTTAPTLLTRPAAPGTGPTTPCPGAVDRAQLLNKVADREWTRERTDGPMLTKVRGIVEAVAEESVTLRVEPFEIEILIPEHTRRAIQARLNEPLELHTIFYIEGGAMVA